MMDQERRTSLRELFRVGPVLGEGGTCIVYDAVRVRDDRRVALKVLHARLAQDEQLRARFAREAAVLRRLEGPHICPVLEFGEASPDGVGPNSPYMALEYIQGPSLRELLKQGPLPMDRAIDVLSQVCDAIEHAHSEGVIHRDLTPANVLLRDGRDVFVVDFGMAKMQVGVGSTRLTGENMVVGTPEYMSPEQAKGDDLDPRSDIYAAGVILYEMLTGSVPFSEETAVRTLTAHLTMVPEPPRRRAPAREISPAMEAVILHALAKDAASRYAHAADLQKALAVAQGAPTDVESVHPTRFSIHDTRPEGRRAAHDTTTDALAHTLPVAFAPPRASSDRPKSVPKPPPSQRRPPAPIVPVEDTERRWTLAWWIALVVAAAIGVMLSLWWPER